MKKQNINKYFSLATMVIFVGMIISASVLTLTMSTVANAQSADSAERIACTERGGTWNSETLRCDAGEGGTIETDCEPEPPGTSLNRENCEIINLLVIGINLLSAVAGIAIVFSFMFAGFQYMTARDNSGQVQKAKQRIVWSIVALALFVFMYALLDFLVPGGVL